MADPILDEIWRVREELLKEHGGIPGLFKYLQKMDRARIRRQKAKAKATPKRRSKRARAASI